MKTSVITLIVLVSWMAFGVNTNVLESCRVIGEPGEKIRAALEAFEKTDESMDFLKAYGLIERYTSTSPETAYAALILEMHLLRVCIQSRDTNLNAATAPPIINIMVPAEAGSNVLSQLAALKAENNAQAKEYFRQHTFNRLYRNCLFMVRARMEAMLNRDPGQGEVVNRLIEQIPEKKAQETLFTAMTNRPTLRFRQQ